ncbi:MAG TPA: hypothetical protein VE646_01840 [Actinomycetota bacterium]|jgi:hypothetical protein|nr:hypothetical protein [Actinomycetota bacterium]
MADRDTAERLDALERGLAELKRRMDAELARRDGAGSGEPQHEEIRAEAREQAARARERAHHVHARARELTEQAETLHGTTARAHEAQQQNEDGLRRTAQRERDGAESGAGPSVGPAGNRRR